MPNVPTLDIPFYSTAIPVVLKGSAGLHLNAKQEILFILPPPFMPAKGSLHEWWGFSTSSTFGNSGHFLWYSGIDIDWIDDDAVGD